MVTGQQSMFKSQTMFNVLHEQADSLDENKRVPGYIRALKDTLDQIVMLERTNIAAKTQIQKKVDATAHDLAKVLIRAYWKPSP